MKGRLHKLEKNWSIEIDQKLIPILPKDNDYINFCYKNTYHDIQIFPVFWDGKPVNFEMTEDNQYAKIIL